MIGILLVTLPYFGCAGDALSDSVASKRHALVTRIIDYLSTTNQSDTTKRFDISFIGGPYYSTEKKLGLGIVAAGLYRRHPQDSLTSQLNLYIDASSPATTSLAQMAFCLSDRYGIDSSMT